MARRRRVNPALFVKFSTTDNTIVVGDTVALASGEDDSVVRADASDSAKMPVIGIAKSVSSGSVVVQLDYLYTLPTSYNLTVATGAAYWADPSNPGKITSTIPTSGILQQVARGKKAGKTLLITIQPTLIDL